jgi:hypothetical protein
MADLETITKWRLQAFKLVVRKNWIAMLCKGFLAFSHIAAWLTPPWTSALEVATISL